MTPALRSRIRFGIATALCFIAATNGFDILARTRISQQPFAKAAAESFYYTAIQPIGILLLLAPFIALAWLSVLVEQEANAVAAWFLFVATVSALGWVYFGGYHGAQQAVLEGKRTAAALSVGMLPFTSVPVLLLAALMAVIIILKWRRRET